jgi:gas vesicle protein GvpN
MPENKIDKRNEKRPAKQKSRVIGRIDEMEHLCKAMELQRNVLIEGPVGVGKTFLVQKVLEEMGREFVRVDGDTRYTEQKLTGWFDPPIVLKKGYITAAFVDGPLAVAMKRGQVLFINELNRMPEAVQNILLPAMDERRITLPKLGDIEAKPGFLVLATQNPREFTATHALSEALMDRFEMISLHYQARGEELEILRDQVGEKTKTPIDRILDLIRATREHGSIKRGASIRAALAIVKLMEGGIDLRTAALMALPSRIEMISSDEDAATVIEALLAQPSLALDQKKK